MMNYYVLYTLKIFKTIKIIIETEKKYVTHNYFIPYAIAHYHFVGLTIHQSVVVPRQSSVESFRFQRPIYLYQFL